MWRPVKGTLFISLRCLRPVNSPYESLALVRKSTKMCIFAQVVNANRFQKARSGYQIHWSFKVRNICVLFSSHFWQSFSTTSAVMSTSCYPMKYLPYGIFTKQPVSPYLSSGSRSHTKKLIETYDRIPSRRGHATPQVGYCIFEYSKNMGRNNFVIITCLSSVPTSL